MNVEDIVREAFSCIAPRLLNSQEEPQGNISLSLSAATQYELYMNMFLFTSRESTACGRTSDVILLLNKSVPMKMKQTNYWTILTVWGRHASSGYRAQGECIIIIIMLS